MNRRQLLIGAGTTVALGGSATLLTLSGMGSSVDYAADIAPLRKPLDDPASFRDLIRYATLAPNGHNTQPWRFGLREKRIQILPDFSRRTPVVDHDDHHLFVSLGCAAENLSLASAARGRPGSVRFDPSAAGSVALDFANGPVRTSALFDAIPKRQSTRADYDGRTVSSIDLDLLAKAATVPGVDLALLTDRARIDRLRDLVVTGNTAQMADAAFVRELKSWLRFNPRQALRTGDGLYSVASGNPALPDWLGPPAFDWLSTAASQNDAYARQIRSSAGIAIFVGAGESPANWVAVGQACQRFALQATALGLKHAFINQPVEVASLRPDLAALVGLKGRRPDIVMRFGYGLSLPWSPRRPAAAVIET
ncbi:Acg family FMN-binding oxidoreductase [Sphingomonas hengshuiensis]|uniref:Tat pathway signal protein n=1 Tax=Sphingomonas hengshuiensis TaxID=1609977 RepID=A0A7U4LEK7_9SPHN|nr:nitroreductase family protein [Sphingomonas hengshuiensis]AJP71308.1 Tat pathway signal protein [Sphingomonas hengshuiensis]